MKTVKEKVDSYSGKKSQDVFASYTTHDIVLNFVIPGKPEPYARARFRRFGKFVQCYNPKAKIEDNYRAIMKNQIPDKYRDEINALLSNKDVEYYVAIKGDFYIPISASENSERTYLKAMKVIRPDVRNGDIDNYLKLLLDAMHGVIYNDDKCVVDVIAHKFYGIEPKSEITATITILTKK